MSRSRFLPAFISALVITAALFWLMQGLINTGDREPPAAPMVATLQRIRPVEEPPPPPPPLPVQQTAPQRVAPRQQSAALTIAPVEFPSQAVQLPELDLQINVSGRLQSQGVLTGVAGGNALAAFAQGQQGFEGADLVPISSARPRYPRSAATRKIEGWVEVIFVVSGEGRVRSVRVLDASPRGIFEDAAVHAMSRWLYAPYYVNGQPIAREATQLFRFRLDEIQELYLWDD
ncbi:MAG: energy transducer TonB [Gammaproteobacteria bacterium]|nr:energy transducer TonB [Gammaproteobacteria bacterium]